jgi:hypothetical protein
MFVSIINDRRRCLWNNNQKHFTHIAVNYSLVFIIFIHFFGQLKIESDKYFFLVSCPKEQVKKKLMYRPVMLCMFFVMFVLYFKVVWQNLTCQTIVWMY